VHKSELLAIRSFNRKMIASINKGVCVLPSKTMNKININTITAENASLLYVALGKSVELSEIQDVIKNRPEKGYKLEDFWRQLRAKTAIDSRLKARITDTSHYFQMKAKANIHTTKVYMTTLFLKEKNNHFKVISRYFGKDS
jgi:general secretion pathway protein K